MLTFKRVFYCIFIIPTFSAIVPPEDSNDDAPCNPREDFSTDCQLKSAECHILYHVLHGVDGTLMTHFLQCCRMNGIPISSDIIVEAYSNAEQPFLSPFDIMDMMIQDQGILTEIRKCAVAFSNLLTIDEKLDRKIISQRFQRQLFWSPHLAASLSRAAQMCPDPVNFDLRPFISCLKDVCLAEVPGILDHYQFVTSDTVSDEEAKSSNIPRLNKFAIRTAWGFAY